MDKLIFHVDVNSAFLSWTAVKKLKEEPESVDLRTIPSAIGGDVSKRHGVITACSIPAKKQGVRTGEPVMRALEKCPELQLFPSDFKTYREYSAKFIEILKKYALAVEQVSIDEAYLDMTGTDDPIFMAENPFLPAIPVMTYLDFCPVLSTIQLPGSSGAFVFLILILVLYSVTIEIVKKLYTRKYGAWL